MVGQPTFIGRDPIVECFRCPFRPEFRIEKPSRGGILDIGLEHPAFTMMDPEAVAFSRLCREAAKERLGNEVLLLA